MMEAAGPGATGATHFKFWTVQVVFLLHLVRTCKKHPRFSMDIPRPTWFNLSFAPATSLSATSLSTSCASGARSRAFRVYQVTGV